MSGPLLSNRLARVKPSVVLACSCDCESKKDICSETLDLGQIISCGFKNATIRWANERGLLL